MSCNDDSKAYLGWAPPIDFTLADIEQEAAASGASGRSLTISFRSDTLIPTGAQSRSVGVYMIFTGSLDPVITAVQLQVVPQVGNNGSPQQQEAISVAIFDARRDPSPQVNCPGLTYYNINASETSTLAAEEFSTAAVVGAIIQFNDAPVEFVSEVPIVAAVGLFLG
ncbi:hypothetical protein VOLCADRAFT_92522 [Volvox carteri f. nagariensis]|uniref:Uncharacterized protein n=1 Tax=Volvox carteri f. nagariensis TaxID=3068 RepID=D8TZW0_VOLCA|nr:uncharacterized protein VOLCADRAFT_92522 [Volvox carteri f. nagariensis]EFJ46993.1 hypothetical protein VOLCADRAFT_92522 [Volvox carteri f. nagariensis]|eukprot:XP_002951888.1 hypothetical protein VOLCADRAFT_92522 [Volvox carteri f. nagariensis]